MSKPSHVCERENTIHNVYLIINRSEILENTSLVEKNVVLPDRCVREENFCDFNSSFLDEERERKNVFSACKKLITLVLWKGQSIARKSKFELCSRYFLLFFPLFPSRFFYIFLSFTERRQQQ